MTSVFICGQKTPGGFTIVEMMVALSMLTVLMATVFNLVLRMEKGYTTEKQIGQMQENLRYATEFLTRALRGAGNNPEGIAIDKITMDPDGNGLNDDIRIQSDFNPPDGNITGDGEDVMFHISGNALRYRNGPPGTAEVILAPNITSLNFTAYDGNGNVTTDVNLMTRLTFTVSAQTDWNSLQTGTAQTRSATVSVNLRR